MQGNAIVVLDVGKSMSKLSLWTSGGELIDRKVRPNARCLDGDFAVLDVAGIAPWVIDTLSAFGHQAHIAHIIPVAHGAGIAVIRDGALAHLPRDYEAAVPGPVRDAYLAERDSFAITGSPALSDGLNAGIQLYQMAQEVPDIFDGATLMPWAQFWAWFLSGVARSEVTSLGCHTDLWAPRTHDFSPMAKRLGWAEKFAPLALAGDVIGHISPKLAGLTGLAGDVQVHCGLHDSNAALIAARAFPEVGEQDATVLSTGTWFVAMRSPKSAFDAASLPAGHDCLLNVDAWGQVVPSARFMGGREIETLTGDDARRVDIKQDQPALLAAVPGLVGRGAMLQPTFAQGFGPFPSGPGQWINAPEDWLSRRAGACLYAALVADVSLDLIGAHNTILIEGRFAEAQVMVQALAALRPHESIYTSHAINDVSFGALSLIIPGLRPKENLKPVKALNVDLAGYRREWRRIAAGAETSA
ncbi:FGGY-family carbohydrate kinase [Hyphomonas johnsonii]|uniref:Carbohydrate kinase n=1 Tax=Hyphomonas johnsonii MHS-2 TaxID=1280950 RepID=A0A059FS32_9PROT|nr:carbohydrate kinase [Hyphomonas johnsonii]KCZ93464.1 carbohydrate kinase [Hyphomonas johnsonii MHS-2]